MVHSISTFWSEYFIKAQSASNNFDHSTLITRSFSSVRLKLWHLGASNPITVLYLVASESSLTGWLRGQDPILLE